jgi:nicotinamide-nucleotide amidase
MPGTAPGLVCPVGERQVVYAVPGVPFEMRIMLEQFVIPDLKRRAGISAVIKSRVLRTWGTSEARLGEMLNDRHVELERSGRATIAFLASGIEGLKVRVTAKAPALEEVDRVLDEEEAIVREVLGQLVFGVDEETMESAVLAMLRERGLTLGAAESVTGGMLGARLTAVPNASDVFRGSVVTYSSELKRALLDVPPGPVVSAVAAEAMALGACRMLGSDVSVATTGVAGPGPQEGHDPGTVYLATCIGGEPESLLVKLPGDRERIRQYAVIGVLNLLRQRLLGVERRV